MRTTLDLNDALLVRAKEFAARERITLTRLIEQGLALVLDGTDAPPSEPPPFRWKVFEPPPGTPTIDVATVAARTAAEDEAWARRQAGLDPFLDPDE